MNKARHIADALGRNAIADTLNVSPDAVSISVRRTKFPASWYPAIRDMCSANGAECPEDAFNWKVPPQPASDHEATR